jgi:membrane protease YdiL (CAAX protease family)
MNSIDGTKGPPGGSGAAQWAASIARRWPITTFFLLTLAVSWPFGLLPPGPSLAAIAAAALIDGRGTVGALLRRATIWRVGVGWYVVALLGPALLFAVAVGFNVVTGARLGPTDQLIDWSELGRLFLVQVVGVFAGAWEELGWRGFALPRLLKRYSPLWASLGVGGLWAAWHIPLFMSGDVPWADAAFLVMASVLFTAVFVRTKQSVLIAFLMHASLNATGGIAIPLFEAGGRLQMYWSMTAVTGVVAIALVALNRRWWLGKPEAADGLPDPALPADSARGLGDHPGGADSRVRTEPSH